MSRSKVISVAMLMVSVLALGTSIGFGQSLNPNPNPNPLRVSGSLPTTPLPPPDLNGPIQMQSIPVGPLEAPTASVPPSASNQFEHHDDFLNLPRIFAHQWTLTNEISPDNVISERYLRSEDPNARGLTLKEAIYIAMQNNPALKAAQLDPVASMETVREANGTFDPNLTAQGDIEKTVVPVTSSLQTGGGDAFVQKFYDWNFGLNKVSAVTNGTWGVTFNNDRSLSNSPFSGVNPSYAPNPRTLGFAAVAAELRLGVRDYQRADRGVGPEAGAMDLRAGAAGFRAENRRRLLERRAVRGKSRGRARRAALQS